MATAATLPTTSPPTMAGMPDPTSSTALCACPSCGTTLDLPELQFEAQKYAALLQQAQRQIAQLQAQVQTLTQQRQAGPAEAPTTTRPPPPSSPTTATAPANISSSASPQSSFLGTGRISQLLGSRGSSNISNNNTTLQPPDSPSSALPRPYSSSSSSPPPPLPAKNSRPTTPATSNFPQQHQQQRSAASPSTNLLDSPSTKSLLKELLMEKKLRAAAEAKIDNTSKEVEELSVSLFEQANEMVASERRARAKLEERVSVLEQRDVEKRVRLDRLEGAMTRLDRVRALLGDDNVADEETTRGGGGGGGREQTADDKASVKSGATAATVAAPTADTKALSKRGDGDDSDYEHDGA